MKDLIDDVITIFEDAITAGTLNVSKVFKGLQNIPQMVASNQWPYIMIDDGGERVEEAGSDSAQLRIYSVVIEVGCFSLKNIETALDDVLDRTNEMKTILEAEASRLKDSHVWGIAITPFGWEEEQSFFRGRRVVVDFMELEEKYSDY